MVSAAFPAAFSTHGEAGPGSSDLCGLAVHAIPFSGIPQPGFPDSGMFPGWNKLLLTGLRLFQNL